MDFINKVQSNYKENKLFYFMVFIFFCVGIALGTFMVRYINLSDSNDLSNYYSTFLQSISTETVNNKALLFNILQKNLFLLAVILICAFTAFGTPVILLIDLIKGFTLGYSFSFLLTTFQGRGIWVALASIIPQNLIYVPCFIALSIISIQFSSIKLRDKFFNKGKVNTILEREVIFKIGVFLCVFVIGSIIEAYFCPSLIKLVVTKIY